MKRLALISLLLVLTGCGDTLEGVKAYVEEVKASPKPAADPLPEVKEFEHFEYSAKYLRSPFVAPQRELTEDVITESRNCLQPDINRRKNPLEAYGLDNLHMRGSLGQKDDLWALVQTLDGDVYKVRKGHYLGLFHGQIVRVSDQQIELTEIVPDGSGCWKERDNILALNTDAE